MHHLTYILTWKVTLRLPCCWAKDLFTHSPKNNASIPKFNQSRTGQCGWQNATGDLDSQFLWCAGIWGVQLHHFQDNQSAILLEKNGKDLSGCCIRHINIRYFLLDYIVKGELRVKYCPTGDMVGDFFTKPLQGSLFHKLWVIILNSPYETKLDNATASQECFGKVKSYANAVQGTDIQSLNVTDVSHMSVNSKW